MNHTESSWIHITQCLNHADEPWKCWMTQIHMNLTRLQSSTSSTILSHLCYHLSWLLGLCNLLPHLGTTGPLLAGWVSIKWRGLTHHLHHNTVALWESRGIGAAGVRTSTQKPSQLSLFCKVLLPLLSFHTFATIPLDFLVWATSCHILRRLGPCCILPEPVSCLLVLFFTRMILRRSDIASYGRQFWFHPVLHSIVRP